MADGDGADPFPEGEEGVEVDDDVAMLDPDHPLLARPQAALKRQLENALKRVEVQLREEEEDLGRSKKEREE